MFSFTMLVLNTSIADIMHGITKDINDQVLKLGAVTNQEPMDIRCQSEGSRIAGLSVMKCAPAAVQTAVRSFQAKQQTDGMQTDQENEAITALRQTEERLHHMRAGVEQQQQLVQQHTVNNDVQQVQVESRKLAQMIQEHDATFQAFEEMRRQTQKEEARMEDELKVMLRSYGMFADGSKRRILIQFSKWDPNRTNDMHAFILTVMERWGRGSNPMLAGPEIHEVLVPKKDRGDYRFNGRNKFNQPLQWINERVRCYAVLSTVKRLLDEIVESGILRRRAFGRAFDIDVEMNLLDTQSSLDRVDPHTNMVVRDEQSGMVIQDKPHYVAASWEGVWDEATRHMHFKDGAAFMRRKWAQAAEQRRKDRSSQQKKNEAKARRAQQMATEAMEHNKKVRQSQGVDDLSGYAFMSRMIPCLVGDRCRQCWVYIIMVLLCRVHVSDRARQVEKSGRVHYVPIQHVRAIQPSSVKAGCTCTRGSQIKIMLKNGVHWTSVGNLEAPNGLMIYE